MTIERSTGIALGAGGVIYGMAGGGYMGLTPELDAAVSEAAKALAEAYGRDIEIRFNSDRESGGAWLKTADGYSAHTGICASLVTARTRAVWEDFARKSERMAVTGLSDWDGHDMGEDSKPLFAADAQTWRDALARNPEGQLTILAHITIQAAGPRSDDLAELPGWMDMPGYGRSYHHGAAESVADALARCLAFVPA
jgi:hypothetical protein